MAKRVLIAELTAPHGVRGLLRLRSFADPADEVFSYKDLQNEKGAVVRLSKRGAASGQFLVAVDGIADRDAADALRGVKLYIDRATLPATKNNEFYITDLEGLETRDEKGAAVGKVARVLNYGAGPVLEIKRPAQQPLLLPFNDNFVPTVDVAGGFIAINMPVEVE
ncbi:MAG: ribosome maturation factor RimM [Bdellovibrionales bacterium]